MLSINQNKLPNIFFNGVVEVYFGIMVLDRSLKLSNAVPDQYSEW